MSAVGHAYLVELIEKKVHESVANEFGKYMSDFPPSGLRDYMSSPHYYLMKFFLQVREVHKLIYIYIELFLVRMLRE